MMFQAVFLPALVFARFWHFSQKASAFWVCVLNRIWLPTFWAVILTCPGSLSEGCGFLGADFYPSQVHDRILNFFKSSYRFAWISNSYDWELCFAGRSFSRPLFTRNFVYPFKFQFSGPPVCLPPCMGLLRSIILATHTQYIITHVISPLRVIKSQIWSSNLLIAKLQGWDFH